ncbi:MAG: YdiU family protein [Lachnospiraceae bacterium]|nr:YdiU family protein [Lachnospiraceae bacterium]
MIPTTGWNLKHTYAELPEIFYRNQKPAYVENPQMVVFNQGLAESLGLNAEELKKAPGIFAGSQLPHGAKPISQAYAGYQFGHFAMLGDGRAVLLGEQIAPDGRRFDIQLKGSGLTPFSRNGDGLAALAPMLREYIISEAMFYLGIPTTRSLAVVLTGEDVIRERVLSGAVLTRIASSHIRVGTFNYISVFGTKVDLCKLADYSIMRHFSWLENPDYENKYLMFFREVAGQQARLIAKWQLAGFIHGVMNTDNMAISGETIDYGPCAFMDRYDPDTVFSSIDTSGRYAYKNQPLMAAWNLSKLAEALLPLLHKEQEMAIELAGEEISKYWDCYHENWFAGMRAKIGLVSEKAEDAVLISELLDLLKQHKLDYTNTFRLLSTFLPIDENPNLSEKSKLPGLSELSRLPELLGLPETPDFALWIKKWQNRIKLQNQNQQDTIELMQKHNPALIPRNQQVEEALTAAENGDLTVMTNLLETLSTPYEKAELYSLPPESKSCGYKTFCGT